MHSILLLIYLRLPTSFTKKKIKYIPQKKQKKKLPIKSRTQTNNDSFVVKKKSGNSIYDQFLFTDSQRFATVLANTTELYVVSVQSQYCEYQTFSLLLIQFK